MAHARYTFVRLMSKWGRAWVEYRLRSPKVVVIEAFQIKAGGDGWKKTGRRVTSKERAIEHMAVMRHEHGYRISRRNPQSRRNPIRGEWWIDDSGTALYADGDVGEMNHEAYVIDALTRSLLNTMDIDGDDEGVGNLMDRENQKKIKEKMKEEEFDGTIEEFVDKAAASVWKDPEQRRYAVEVSQSYGQMDARMYGMRYDGWKRVQGHNIETWSLTAQDLKHITNGLYDAAGEDIADEDVFNVYVFSTKMWYQDVPWSVLSEDDPGKLRIYGTKDNPAPHAPVISYAAAHRWEPLAKARGVSAVARSPRGFMRAYERAGTWARLDPWWKARRNAFVARHMAQGQHESLWKRDKSGKLQPSRRCLALLMWAYRPR